MDKKLDLKRIADLINRERPDLVGLQEVDRGAKRTEGKDEIAELAKLTRMDFSFAHNLDFQGGQYGVAVLSRFLIQHADHHKYENRRETERRGMLRVEVEVDGKKLNFVQQLDTSTRTAGVESQQRCNLESEGVKLSPGILMTSRRPCLQVMRTKFDDAGLGVTAKVLLSRRKPAETE